MRCADRPIRYHVDRNGRRQSLPISSSQTLHHVMNGINYYREYASHAIRDQPFKMSNRLLFCHLQVKTITDLEDCLIWLHPDIRDIGIHHEGEEVKDEVAGLS